ncbi:MULTISPECIES: L-serine ammonia-lyase [Deefgea]|uniref:L-serine dehydratase n=1 Tax=Deefgea chitinilytica TaxID=570276 RepID=A0ABS2CB33_9NEIS|nr:MULTISPECIES: L-serine ammonia-lyase [Deefgea]MBM5570668.1 L-serine ammonia-lyase [Deefgea chitinilytica]MBM9887897.1 L-serine ammonia-lyase [Deefgea sp. CFH1-16]
MLSVFDLFKIGIGPSSSHTVGPMVAAKSFVDQLAEQLPLVSRVVVDLYGSLALTGEGHGTVGATLLGLEGNTPKEINPDLVPIRLAQLMQPDAKLRLSGVHDIAFSYSQDLQLHKHLFLKQHANGMRFRAFDFDGNELAKETYFSVGGGFVSTEAQLNLPVNEHVVPFPFRTAADLLAHCRAENKTIAQIVLANELVIRSEAEVRIKLLEIANVMHQSIHHGCTREGELPGAYHVKRRAPAIFRKMVGMQLTGRADFMLWPMVYAFAVSEENASGGRIVTAPTNGAAGIVPAVLQYFRNFTPTASEAGIVDFLLTAAAIGMLYKMNASISGAEVGCQGEVGVACSMAAGAYCAVLGGTLEQVENAAEIGMEHHLGLTCDPVGGLVQIPCVERNGVAAEKAIKIAQLALLESGEHKVSLDKVIETMYRTGMDMHNTYKETSLGGLALTVGVPAC